jgi:hypothetical protein
VKSKPLVLMAAAILGIGFEAAALSAFATPINSSMLGCQPVQAPQSDVTHSGSGVSTNILAVGPRFVTCSVTLGKLTPNATAAVFFITGSNSTLAAASTSCTLTSYHYTGRLLGSMSFITSEAHYFRGLFVPAEMVSLEAYASLTCQLPQHATGTLESVVAWL